jgi:hypothetical protein
MTWVTGRRSVAWALAFATASQLGLALTPQLADRAPLVLLALRPQPEFMVLLSGQSSAIAVVAVVAPLRWLVHFVYVEVGRWAGQGPLYKTRPGRWIVDRLGDRRTSWVLLWSCLIHLSTPVDIALGAGGTSRRRVAIMLAAGSLLTTTFYVTVGTAISPLSSRVLGWLVEHRAGATVVSAALAVAGFVLLYRTLSAEGNRRGHSVTPNTPKGGDQSERRS